MRDSFGSFLVVKGLIRIIQCLEFFFRAQRERNFLPLNPKSWGSIVKNARICKGFSFKFRTLFRFTSTASMFRLLSEGEATLLSSSLATHAHENARGHTHTLTQNFTYMYSATFGCLCGKDFSVVT